MTIDRIYLSQANEDQEIDYDHLNTEVIVYLTNGDKYRATFVSISELENQFAETQEVQGNDARKYFWSENLVLVRGIKKEELLPMIEYMIEEGDFQIIFEKL